MENRCSEHQLVRSQHSYSPRALFHRMIQKIYQMQLSHDPISIRLASDALVLGPIPGPNKGPYLIPSVNNTSEAVPQEPTTSEPSCWFLGADSSKNNAGVTYLPYNS